MCVRVGASVRANPCVCMCMSAYTRVCPLDAICLEDPTREGTRRCTGQAHACACAWVCAPAASFLHIGGKSPAGFPVRLHPCARACVLEVNNLGLDIKPQSSWGRQLKLFNTCKSAYVCSLRTQAALIHCSTVARYAIVAMPALVAPPPPHPCASSISGPPKDPNQKSA